METVKPVVFSGALIPPSSKVLGFLRDEKMEY